ncbi:MAG TPA: 4-(cytidine 5'-diphospho)-2-C-methyl-D-erythritol kinase [Gemmatimonadales bacterium]
MTGGLTLEAAAKLNLFLRVLAREEDGYHGIETLFCRVGLADTLTFEPREPTGVTLDVEGSRTDVGPDEENLAVRAARLVLDATGNRFGVAITLTKRIPVAAGLGGGSSDAAAALQAVNALAGNPVPRHELFQFAARLGADVPFFLSGAALALGWGRGERLFVVPPLPRAPVLVLCPPIAIRTVEAYGWVDQVRAGVGRRGAVALDLEALASWGSVGRMAGNDFEVPVFGKHPEVRAAYEALAATQPLVCRLSGSGAALFAIYRSERDREDACLRLGRRFGPVIETETV